MTTESLIDINLIREWVSEAGQIALNQSAQLVVDIKI